jgi:hypothetical protein
MVLGRVCFLEGLGYWREGRGSWKGVVVEGRDLGRTWKDAVLDGRSSWRDVLLGMTRTWKDVFLGRTVFLGTTVVLGRTWFLEGRGPGTTAFLGRVCFLERPWFLEGPVDVTLLNAWNKFANDVRYALDIMYN